MFSEAGIVAGKRAHRQANRRGRGDGHRRYGQLCHREASSAALVVWPKIPC